jgi:pilus assembly protein CpaE
MRVIIDGADESSEEAAIAGKAKPGGGSLLGKLGGLGTLVAKKSAK